MSGFALARNLDWLDAHGGQISALSKRLKSRGTDLALVPVPRAMELYPKSFLATDIPRSGVISPRLRFLTAELLRANVEVLDLFPRMKAAADKGEVAIYLPKDAHWTDAAQRFTARLIAKHLGHYSFTCKQERHVRFIGFAQRSSDSTVIITNT